MIRHLVVIKRSLWWDELFIWTRCEKSPSGSSVRQIRMPLANFLVLKCDGHRVPCCAPRAWGRRGGTWCTKSWEKRFGTEIHFRFAIEFGPCFSQTWRTFVNSCMWASVYLVQEREHFRRVLRHMDVKEIQQKLSTTQNQTQSVQQEESCSACTDNPAWDQSP